MREKKKETNLPLQQQESFDEIQDQDREKYNDIFVKKFLFVDMDVHRCFYVNQGRIQYEIFLVLFLFENRCQSAKITILDLNKRKYFSY
jgi:hypothetical protein